MLVWGPVVWIPGIPENERDCYLGVPLESQTSGPQTNRWALADKRSFWKKILVRFECPTWKETVAILSNQRYEDFVGSQGRDIEIPNSGSTWRRLTHEDLSRFVVDVRQLWFHAKINVVSLHPRSLTARPWKSRWKTAFLLGPGNFSGSMLNSGGVFVVI